ncbi:type II toxin-antitoxin system death-on-curing family toxin [Anaeroselena agilis]|uniref:Type II toxin-antitoxin system death-on-curing family toxin n=1 Tax=Anaeroselena agilis TaxID=3063788 RepID=A0ABU3NUI6_9FIRM|nr:type II toxin-antitoxin system death-on-curing family toxin [Selenomonadales bacterium 4137-cl]
MRYLSMEEVIYIYSEIVQRTGAQPGINDDSLLDSILAKPLVAFEGEELYPDIFTKAAVLMYAMVNSKPFASANRATALMCSLFLLRANGYNIIAAQDSLVELAEGTETGKYKVDHLVNWYRKNAVPA